MSIQNVIIIGAAGRDFHNFNVFFRDNVRFKVVAFTAAQIPDISGRKYPAELAGNLYPDGIPIFDENELLALIKKHAVATCYFSYSDVSNQKVMDIGAKVLSAGASYTLLGPYYTMIKSKKPVVAVVATRTGCGKSQTTRKVAKILREHGKKVVAIRHPMPYGDLRLQKVQRFATLNDLKKHKCTIEEMEEYEPHIAMGNVIYSGVDYEAILQQAENDPDGCDIILWDGGNNDTPFYKPDIMITVADPHRPGAEMTYYPGTVNARMADVVILNKIDTAAQENIIQVRQNIAQINPDTIMIDAASPIIVPNPEVIRGKRVLVIEDGPTLTHGEMTYGAGIVAAQKHGAKEIIDPRPFLSGKLKETFEIYPEIGPLLPAMGYSKEQLNDLEKTIHQTDCDGVIVATPIDLGRLIKIKKPHTRVFYDLQEIGKPDLEDVLKPLFERRVMSDYD